MKKVFYGGNVITMDKTCERANCFIVEDGTIIEVGSEEVLDSAPNDAEKIDLCGKTVLPAFTETHMHVLSLGMFLKDVNLQTASGINDVIERSKEYIEKNNIMPGTWIRGRGWNHDNFLDENRFLTRYDLDKISTECPIALTRTCGHVISVNSKVLELLGMEKEAPVVEGGQIDLDENGVPLGIFREKARWLVLDAIPEPSKEELKELIRLTTKEALAHGITTIHTDDFKDVPNNFQKVIDTYEEMKADGELNIRIYEQCNLPSVEKIQKFIEKGYKTGYGDDLFKLGPLKLLSDGALGARTAYLRNDYSDDPGQRGFPLFSQEELTDMITLAHKSGMQVAIHAIGDAAMDMVMTGIAHAKELYPRNDERHGIIHCQIMAQDQFEKMKALNLIAYIQPIFLNYDILIADSRIGSKRAKTSYAWRTLIENGIHVCGGSDCPVESLNVMENVYTAICRKNLKGNPEEGWHPEQNLTLREALELFTTGAAYASFEEDRKGSISSGKMADFVVINENILDIDAEKIKNIDIQQTYLAGKLVFQR